MIRHSLCLMLILSLFACAPAIESNKIDKKGVVAEVKQMLDKYHHAIKENGLTAEFNYLDHSSDFFWVPPGYTSALTYDSVKTILEANASNFSKVEFQWDNLQVFPLTNEIANYTGVVGGIITDASGNSMSVSIIESGTLIKRSSGWKLLSGQSANLTID